MLWRQTELGIFETEKDEGMSRRTWGMVLVVLMLCGVAAGEDSISIGEVVDDFSLQDYRGRAYQLSEFRDSPVVVLAVLGTECPLVKLYAGKLQELADRYADRGVSVIGLNANRQDSVTDMAGFARRQELQFPILKDVGNQVVDRIGAERTPSVVVLDAGRRMRTLRSICNIKQIQELLEQGSLVIEN